MTNEDYIQWEPLLKKVAYKYRNNIFHLEIEDLIQIGAIGLMYGFDTYKEGAGASQKSYFYNCIEWRIIREFTNLKRAKRFCLDTISLDTPLKNDEDTFIGDVVPDDKVNVEALALDSAIIKSYIDEIERVLVGKDKEVIMYKLFDNLSNYEIGLACELTVDQVSTTFKKAKDKLIKRSCLIQLEYSKYLEKRYSKYEYFEPSIVVAYKERIDRLKDSIKAKNKMNNDKKNKPGGG